jgi:hypothetical protein
VLIFWNYSVVTSFETLFNIPIQQAQTGRPLFQIAQRIALFLARAQRRQTVIHLVQVLQRQRENDAAEEEESDQQVGLHRMNSNVSVDSVDDSDEELDDDGQKQFSVPFHFDLYCIG